PLPGRHAVRVRHPAPRARARAGGRPQRPGLADRARARGAQPARPRLLEPRHRRGARDHQQDGQEPPEPHLREDRRPLPCRGHRGLARGPRGL
ncbi:MAG: hypothetical protein AVDCRST_MAG30-917, partial [uncultured Solirubrobacteraceae bacterium]